MYGVIVGGAWDEGDFDLVVEVDEVGDGGDGEDEEDE